MTKWYSHAQWALSTFRGMDGTGISTDIHNSKTDALGICEALEREGFGSMRSEFPLYTWVSPVVEKPKSIVAKKTYTRDDVLALWACVREHNHTIPDEALDEMRDDLMKLVNYDGNIG